MKKQWGFNFIAVVAALFFLLALTAPAFAHGKTSVGDYEIEIGFHNEPAYLGQPNSLDLFVTNSKTGEMVNGLENTLKAELIFGSSKTELPLYAQDEVDGAYGADVVPTAAGDYTWHITGMIESTPVDISMTSAPDTFGSVEPMTQYEFPSKADSAGDLQSQVTAANRTAQIGIAVGGIGALLGLIGLVVALRAGRK